MAAKNFAGHTDDRHDVDRQVDQPSVQLHLADVTDALAQAAVKDPLLPASPEHPRPDASRLSPEMVALLEEHWKRHELAYKLLAEH